MAIDLCRGRAPADRAMRRGQGEMAARRGGGLLLALRPRGRTDRFRRPGARFRAAASRRSAARSRSTTLGVRPFHGRLRRRRRFARRSADRRARSSWCSPPSPARTRVSSASENSSCIAGRFGRAADEPGGVVDFPAFLRAVESGRFRAATNVFPSNRLPPMIAREKSKGCCCRRIAPAR